MRKPTSGRWVRVSHDRIFPTSFLEFQQLVGIGGQYKQKYGALPTLIVAILPESSTDIYTAIKQWVIVLTCGIN